MTEETQCKEEKVNVRGEEGVPHREKVAGRKKGKPPPRGQKMGLDWYGLLDILHFNRAQSVYHCDVPCC
jgi:hypothetical protein